MRFLRRAYPFPHSLLTLALIGGFIAPFMLCGIVFVALGIYMVANSLEVFVDARRIVTQRRLFGFLLSRRELSVSELAAIEPAIPARFQNAFGAGTTYRLLARARGEPRRDVIVAESLRGETVMEQTKQEIEAACNLRCN